LPTADGPRAAVLLGAAFAEEYDHGRLLDPAEAMTFTRRDR